MSKCDGELGKISSGIEDGLIHSSILSLGSYEDLHENIICGKHHCKADC